MAPIGHRRQRAAQRSLSQSLSLSSSLMKPGWRPSLSRKLWVNRTAGLRQTLYCLSHPFHAGGQNTAEP